MDDRLKWALVGVLFLFGTKYLIVGLDAWNGALHPGRTEADPWVQPFRKPLLGLLR